MGQSARKPAASAMGWDSGRRRNSASTRSRGRGGRNGATPARASLMDGIPAPQDPRISPARRGKESGQRRHRRYIFFTWDNAPGHVIVVTFSTDGQRIFGGGWETKA